MDNSLSTGVAGLLAHQRMLNVTGNNLANVNTTAFKSQRVDFADSFYSSLRPGSAGGNSRVGGVNPSEIGAGSVVSRVDRNFTQSTLEPTGRDFDLAIQGDGFFVLHDGTRNVLTRSGTFGVDGRQLLVDQSTGFPVQRFGAVGETTAATAGFQLPDDNLLRVPIGTTVLGQATSTLEVEGNLDSLSESNTVFTTPIEFNDAAGTNRRVEVQFQRVGDDNAWRVSASLDPAVGTLGSEQLGEIRFNPDGSFSEVFGQNGNSVPLTINYANGGESQTMQLKLGGESGFVGMRQVASATATQVSADGYEAGTLLSASVQHDGQVIGIGSNGRQVPIGQIAIAAVVNQSGMSAVGQNQFIVTPNSGQLNIGAGTTGGRGQVMAGTLELSNVDLAYEFTRLIVAQRGFSASARHISVTEEMLEEAGNIIR